MNYVYNKHTGEKIYFSHGMFCFRRIGCKDLGDALAKGWTFGSEDYEEPKEYWYISEQATVVKMANNPKDIPNFVSGCSSIGNLFETEEEAEKAVEKLKAWKRLKDKGFKFEGIKEDYTRILQSQKPFRTGKRYLHFDKSEDEEWMKENWKDLDLLFGGEE